MNGYRGTGGKHTDERRKRTLAIFSHMASAEYETEGAKPQRHLFGDHEIRYGHSIGIQGFQLDS
ncbi:hypothetical protein TWF281_002431 [Arthrobotrys megalospora]